MSARGAADVALAFKAFDPHELLAHAVALGAGLYAEAGLVPRLVDTSGAPEADLDPGAVLVACGSALLARAGAEDAEARPEIVLAACIVPMFWLCAAEGGPATVEPGARIAGFPAPAPPAAFLRHVLRERGLDPGADLTIAACRDDTARLGLLRTGDADLALVSSAVLPLEAHRLRVLIDVGAALGRPLPSTGLAVGAGLRAEHPELVGRLIGVHRDALGLLHTDPRAAEAALERVFSLPGEVLPIVRGRLTRNGAVPGLDQISVDSW